MIKNILLGNANKEMITQVYGFPGVGKTNVCIMNLVNYGRDGKVVYIDTEGGLFLERIKQVAKDLYDKIIENLLIYDVYSFKEQDEVIRKEIPLISENINLIVVDNISSLYRLEVSDSAEKNMALNKMLGQQMQTLLKISKIRKIPVIVTNQARDTNDGLEATGGRILEYWSKCIVRLEKNSDRLAILEKHPYAPNECVRFKIVNDGIKFI
ncbi:DNA repair and recombination protein RadB [Methanocaldococcus sp.]